MKTSGKKSFLAGIPSWAFALFTLIAVFIILMAIPDTISEGTTAEIIVYIILGLVLAICCFFIVRHNPKSIWYVPLIINAMLIISAIVEGKNWKASDWIPVCSIWVLSIIASIIGAQMGKRKAISGNNKTI